MSRKKRTLTRRAWIYRFSTGISLISLVSLGYRREDVKNYLSRLGRKINSARKSTLDTREEPSDPYYRNEPIPNEAEYKAFIGSLGLRYFSSEEIIRPHRNYRYGVRNSIPPKPLWTSIIPALKLADEMRHELGVKVSILSVYRSHDYNTAISGASRSQHMKNRAIDLKFDCSSDKAYLLANKLRDSGAFRGGVGWYPSFIHIDTRGYNANWGKT